MKRFLIGIAAMAAITLSIPAISSAEYVFGDETKGIKISSNDADLNVRIRLQPRLDYGDIVSGADYSESDMYIRRARLELTGHLMEKLKYNLTLAADKWDKIGNSNKVTLLYANVEWRHSEEFGIIVGKDKLPYSRTSLVSSSRQLFIERPASTEAAKKLFGETDAYYQPKIAARGKFLEGVIGYEAALADGWQNSEVIKKVTGNDQKITEAAPLIIGRVELSPPGWVEKSRSEAHLGKGKHLTAGLNYAKQGSIKYADNANTYEEDRSLWGFDLSGHYEGFTGQFEYNSWTTGPSGSEKKPKGWYAQAGYFIEGTNLEPAVRFETYDTDSNAADKEEKVTTVGVNWYLKGHSFKVSANWAHTDYEEAGKDSTDVYQAQAQVYF